MVIERFLRGPQPVYRRAAERGRMLPNGLHYLHSWIDNDTRSRCFQLMETDNPQLLQQWAARWADLVEFEFIPVISSTEAATEPQRQDSPRVVDSQPTRDRP